MLPTNRLSFGEGVDLSADPLDVPPNRVHDIVNVDITPQGGGFVRDDYTTPSLLPGARCLQGVDTLALCAKDDTLYRVDYPLAATPLFTGLDPRAPVAYTQFAGGVWFTDGARVGVVAADGTSAAWVGLPVPAAPQLSAVAYGGLTAGRYGVALSFISDNEESGMSPTTFIYSTAGIDLTALPPPPAGCEVRVYMTQPGGDRLYHLMDVPTGLLPPILIGSLPEGKQAMNQYLTTLPGGRLIAGYNGRIYVARGNVLYFSEPLYYGLTSLQYGFVLYDSEITLLQAVETGLYVGTRDHLHYMSGEGPSAARTKLAAPPPAPWSGTTIVAGQLGGEYAKRGGLYALWLSALGYYIGTPDGVVLPLQADRIQGIAASAISTATLATRGINRVVTTLE